jgi:hypothetical protein
VCGWVWVCVCVCVCMYIYIYIYIYIYMNRAYKDVWEHSASAPEPSVGSSGGADGGGAHGLGSGSAMRGAGGVLGGLQQVQQVHFPQRKRRRVQEGPSILAPAKRCPVFLVRIRYT